MGTLTHSLIVYIIYTPYVYFRKLHSQKKKITNLLSTIASIDLCDNFWENDAIPKVLVVSYAEHGD